MEKYHRIRQIPKMKVEPANKLLIEWLHSYEIKKEDIYRELGISLDDRHVFNRRYNRWRKN
jgi:hypothetical protein